MSYTISYPVAGINHLIIEALAADAHVHRSDSARVEIVCEGRESSSREAFTVDDGALSFHGDPVTQVAMPRGMALTVKSVAMCACRALRRREPR
jgi:hypothetical protein